MKKSLLAAILAAICLLVPATQSMAADDEEWDMDSFFEEPEDGEEVPGDTPEGDLDTEEEETEETVLASLVQRTGFSLDTSASLRGGFNPGFAEAPWFWHDYPADIDYSAGVGLTGGLGLDFQMSNVLRLRNHFSYSYPSYTFAMDEVFVDYNLFNLAYFRIGLTTVTWGQSRNYTFTDLPSRLPTGKGGGPSTIVKIDVPMGIGGLQLLTLTRQGFMEKPTAPNPKEMGYGMKYNMATRWFDIDIGSFFHNEMPLRTFMSLKTTIVDTELYADFLYSMQFLEQDGFLNILQGEESLTNDKLKHSGAFGIGVVQDLFNDMFTINPEIFFNKETESTYYQDSDDFHEATTNSFIENWNAAINFLYRPAGTVFKDLRLAVKCLYSFEEKSAWLVPAIYFDPIDHLRIYFSVPMALGSRESWYYTHNEDTQSPNRPFSMFLGVEVNGNYSFGHRD